MHELLSLYCDHRLSRLQLLHWRRGRDSKPEMPTYGKIGEYEPDSEDWSQYVERLENFLVANNITSAEKKQATFLAVIGPSAYRILRSLVAPEKPNEKSYTDLKKLLSDHYCPKPSEIVQRSKFYKRIRHPGESVATFCQSCIP